MSGTETIVSWDPGLRESGAAWWEDGKLTEVAFLDSEVPKSIKGTKACVLKANTVVNWFDVGGGMIDTFVYEKMQTRKGKESAHAALIDLTFISGMIAGYCQEIHAADIVSVKANLWTKGRPKHVNQLVVEKLLETDELRVLRDGLKDCPEANLKEIYDAVGIGLYHLKRWK